MRRRLCGIAAVAVIAVAGCGGSSSRPGGAATAVTSGSIHVSAATRTSDAGFATRSTDDLLPVDTIQLARPLAEYTQYVEGLAAKLPVQVAAIESAASHGDIAAAEAAWLSAHVTYLRIGQDDDAYGSFGDLGEQIDGLADGLPRTTANRRFTGFHKVEFDLWRRRDAAEAATDAGRLLKFVRELTPDTISGDLPLQTLSLDGWVLRCHEILEDALRDSLSQDDDYGSNTDLASIAADVAATREMLQVLKPLIVARAPSIVHRGAVDLRMLERAVAGAGGAHSHTSLVRLGLRRRQILDETVGASTAALAPVSEILQISTPGS